MQQHLNIKGLGVWDWSVQQGSITVSPEWLEMTGYSEEVIPELPPGEDFLRDAINVWVSYIHPADQENARLELVKYLIFKSSKTYLNRFRFRKKDGSYMSILSTGFAEWDKEGNLIRFRTTHTDVGKASPTEKALLAHMSQLGEAGADARESVSKLQTQIKRLIQAIKYGAPVALGVLATFTGTLSEITDALELLWLNTDNPIQTSAAATPDIEEILRGEGLDFPAFEQNKEAIIDVLQANIGAADRAVFGFYEPGPTPTRGRIGAQAKRQSDKPISKDVWIIQENKFLEERLSLHLQGEPFFVDSVFAGLFDTQTHISEPGFWASPNLVELPVLWYVGIECRPNRKCDIEEMKKNAEISRDEIVEIFNF